MYLSGMNPLKLLLKDKSLFWSMYITSSIRTAYLKMFNKKLRLKRYAGVVVINHDATNELLKTKLIEDRPFFFGRHGSVEMNIASQALYERIGIKDIDLAIVSKGANCGFFYNNKKDVHEFLDEFVFSFSQVDIFGTLRWINEDYFIKRFLPKDTVVSHANVLDFWRFDIPFTSALEGKKVLIIHPMVETIKSQYAKRKYLFDNPNVLPPFDLRTLKAVQTIMGNRDPRFNSWFEALDFMYDEAMKIDFDIAILGCGSYGMPLAARLKQAGKKVIYMGVLHKFFLVSKAIDGIEIQLQASYTMNIG